MRSKFLPKESSSYNIDGSAFVSILTLILVILKLTGVIDCSWVWVLSPIWITIACAFAIVAVTIVVAIILIIIDYFIERRG